MKPKVIGICELALPTPLRGPLVCRVLKDLGLAAVELKLGTVKKTSRWQTAIRSTSTRKSRPNTVLSSPALPSI